MTELTASEKEVLKNAVAILSEKFMEATNELSNTEENCSLTLHKFGSFRVYVRDATTRVNPKTGAKVAVPAKKVVKFKPSGYLLKSLNGLIAE